MTSYGFTSSLTGRADLVRARQLGDEELETYLAGHLGYGIVEIEPHPIELRVSLVDDAGPVAAPPTSAVVARDIPFWRATHFRLLDPPAADAQEVSGRAAAPKDARPNEEPERQPVDLSFLPLSNDASLLTRLRAAASAQRIRGEIDVDRIVDEWGRGRFLAVLPSSSRKVWGRSVQVFVDRARRLIPYWEDQTRACRALREFYPPEGYTQVILPEGCSEPSSMRIGRQMVEYQPPTPGTAVVALSDLGVLARGGSSLVALWAERGRRLRELDVKPLAVVPFRRAACPRELSRYWTILPWETSADADAPALGDEESAALVLQILTLLSFTLRVEPQLIRFIRRLLPTARSEPGVESLVWQHNAFTDPHCEAAELSPSLSDSLRAALARQDPETRKRIYERVEVSHSRVYEGVWYAEMGNLGNDDFIDQSQRLRMYEWFESQEQLLRSTIAAGEGPSLEAWHTEVSDRLLTACQNRGRLGEVLHRIWAIVHRDDPAALLPPGADLRLLPLETERTIELCHRGDRLVASVDRRAGSPLALIRTHQSRLKVELVDDNRENDFWDGDPPRWAEKWGRDEYGPWVALRVGDATKRLRWIPPGKFWMGSPEDEEGRWDDEGPRHEESIAPGFWMFETPCTQALWEAVTGENPSHFKGADLPAERVSWDQCQEFLKRLNAMCPGLELGLPSEAQWEYACRAGTETPRYREDLDEIAWYAHNTNGETHPVGQKAANAWGLFDTLGNVDEWCDNVWTDDYNAKKKDATSAHRVIRGGSWHYDARVVRAAYRFHDEPAYRNRSLGFRCAEFRAPGPVAWGRGAERAVERGGARAEHRGDRDTASEAGWINLDTDGMNCVPFTALPAVRLSSDVEQLVLRTMSRPEWASAIGRDKYGLWTEFAIEGNATKPTPKRAAKKKATKKKNVPSPTARAPVVRQRLRWIPPGRFLMGSPDDEEGRDSDEGPRQEVTIDEGFWMFDTPCTQALWEALMDDNPSEFKSPDRPVETVSWKDCQTFLERLNAKVGLSLRLPSEAQWEYACRAGTSTATYAGPMEIKGANNAPILDAIAWYGGNSGLDLELSNGYYASDWPEKQFQFDKAGTRPVAKKKANPWGLYDMLGNVWEWCDDDWVEDYSQKFPLSASAESASARRVIRGGSWCSDAGFVRAAYRGHDGPPDRDFNRSFRCAEFRPGSRAERDGERGGGGAEHPGDRDPTSATSRLREDVGFSDQPT
jgi:formylglycine-generating enzyme required for sulfatase activity